MVSTGCTIKTRHQSITILITPFNIDYLRNVFEKYIKIIADAALVHAQHRQRGVVLLHNILEAFKLLGVTMYWPSEVDMPEEGEDEDDENDDEDFVGDADEENDLEEADESESEVEEDPLNKTNDEAENEEEVKESRFKIDSVAFRRIADAVVEPQEEEEDDAEHDDEEDGNEDEDEEDDSEWAIQESALDAMQASAEEFTSQLVESALKMVQLYERKEISPADLKFVLTLWQNTPGGSDIMKRIRI